MGLKAAARELGRPVGEMGNPARGAGRTGASHPMVVNEAVLALLRPKPDLAQLASEPADVRAAAQAAVDEPAGLGTIASYATEVALPATGTWANPGKGGAQADIVITAPEDGVPLLFVEIDNCFESAQVLAAKIDKYMRFCQRKVKDVDGKERPMWRTAGGCPTAATATSRTRRCCSSATVSARATPTRARPAAVGDPYRIESGAGIQLSGPKRG
ncbi:replication-relaxation family protein [Streptomyces cinerochromogenes]|uniref:replication-relaxation family protein n=1 Tax=Streptomyces cinerochromogenes TaxID=66422 RepID=UPI0033A038A0